jgi:hypothetical protein
MQYRLSTLFLIFFVFATSLAAFGAWGIGVAILACMAALCLNRVRFVVIGWFCLISVIIALLTLLLYWTQPTREIEPPPSCANKMKGIGLGVLLYEDAKGHYPPVYERDKKGRKQFSWLVTILPHIEYGAIYDQLNKNEPWNSPQNASVLSSCKIEEFECPIAISYRNVPRSNYLAIIGPGTIWKEEGCKTEADLPHGSSNAIIAIETVDLEKHWAEPFALTADEVLENMKTGKGVRISSNHPDYVNVVFADRHVRRLPSQMPLSMWQKILYGEIDDFDKLEDQIDPNAPDMIDVSRNHPPSKMAVYLSIGVWLVSVLWLFYRAIKSRGVNLMATGIANYSASQENNRETN